MLSVSVLAGRAIMAPRLSVGESATSTSVSRRESGLERQPSGEEQFGSASPLVSQNMARASMGLGENRKHRGGRKRNVRSLRSMVTSYISYG